MVMEGMGLIKTIVNGKLIEEKTIEGHYNGKDLELSTILNRPLEHIHQHKSYRLSNDDIMKLMSRPSSKLSLEERLTKDYSKTKSKKNKNKNTRKSKKIKKSKNR